MSKVEQTPAMAVIARNDHGEGIVLWHLGLDSLIDEGGLEELNPLKFAAVPHGVYVWEGVLRFDPDADVSSGWERSRYNLEEKSWRVLTFDEALDVARGVNPLQSKQCERLEPLTQYDSAMLIRCRKVAVLDGLCEHHYQESLFEDVEEDHG